MKTNKYNDIFYNSLYSTKIYEQEDLEAYLPHSIISDLISLDEEESYETVPISSFAIKESDSSSNVSKVIKNFLLKLKF